MQDSLPIALFTVGLLAGLPVNALVVSIPAFLERQWSLDAAQMLGQESPTEHRPRSSVSLLPDQINARFSMTLLVMGGLSSWAALHYGVGTSGLAALVLVGGLLTLSLIDLDHQLLPDVLVLPLLWLGLIVNSFELFTTLSHALWGAVGGYLVLWAIRFLSRLITGDYGIGQGDLKLLAMLGAWGGWQILPVTLVLSSLVFAVVGSTLLALGKIERTALVPFGPYLAAAGWLALLYTPAWSVV
ncbi:prepilin peptidase [Pseudomonas sp. AP19]|uniref:prepilin peptidase n=1 Tax=Pseudomonas sp. AP19 TaxID=1535623 RepID=UPI00084AB37C|nr:A24 family peptidase [Pseudomonas sp. AP19]OEC68350.1 hypothetical protein A7D21_19475 [Pseudomonas sp. AP19]